jgi:hypothetical protein
MPVGLNSSVSPPVRVSRVIRVIRVTRVIRIVFFRVIGDIWVIINTFESYLVSDFHPVLFLSPA